MILRIHIKVRRFFLAAFCSLFMVPLVSSQNIYDYIDLSENHIRYYGNAELKFHSLFNLFYKQVNNQREKINIVHIGDSHIQADVFTGQVRKKIKGFLGEEISPRGFIFPFTIAKSNNPSDFRIIYSGNWDACYATVNRSDCNYGLSGVSISTHDSLTRIKIKLNEMLGLEHRFDRLKIFYNLDRSDYEVYPIHENFYYSSRRDAFLNYVVFDLSRPVDSVDLIFMKGRNESEVPLEIYGFSLESQRHGVQYNAVGYNGATIETFLLGRQLIPNLIALNPDLIVISLGTNSGLYNTFRAKSFGRDYRQLLEILRDLFPDIPIMATTPNDNHYDDKINKNMPRIREVILNLAGDYDLAVWDFYKIMGGQGSMLNWLKTGYAKADKIHFNSRGYLMQGDLFYSALLNAYMDYLKTNSPEKN